MSQESLTCSKPKKFLKKGEGLKRFAAYNPPLPLTAHKKRETFVKFNLENNIYAEILKNDSINLSTEIPKIPPPKIMHTPVRPISRTLGALRAIPFNVQGGQDEFLAPLPPPRKTNSPPIPTLAKRSGNCKAATKTSETREILAEKVARAQELEPKEPKRYNLRGSRRANTNNEEEPQKEAKRTGRRKLRAVVERHVGVATPVEQSQPTNTIGSESQINGELDHLLKKIEDKKTSMAEMTNSDHDDQTDHDSVRSSLPTNRTYDLSTSSPKVCLHELGQQIQQIQATANELKDRIRYHERGVPTSVEHAPTTRSSRRAITHPKPSVGSTLTLDSDIICNLLDGIAVLSEKFDNINLRK